MTRLTRYALAFLVAVVVFASSCATAPTTKLDDRAWRLSAWSVSSQRATDHVITARFADGRVSGRSGVNSYGGSAVIGPGGTLSIGPLATTKMAGPEPAMRAEGAYLRLLGDAKAYRLAGDELTLVDGNGNVLLVFGPDAD